ncbi:hypothetical protein Moror_9190 [Moniliophthora roreri MCA 2997]|uniref:Uncharacterized protein n=2 Tax=Moniliophthora roreri TaxID=221103 RepID=V2WTT4_MONRO|nr:hypothetical protein Moror_9190 [Moniliophthora roreri MCA 2997]KAI3600995.1 hypothetical protein WG66_014879 [Moniliophthora roreri]
MAPLPALDSDSDLDFTFSDAKSTTNVVIILFRSSSSNPLPIAFLLVYILVPLIFNWRYPIRSVDTLQNLVTRIEKTIRDNTSVKNKHALQLKKCKEEMKARLRVFHNHVNTLKDQREPHRSRLRAWFAFRWKMIRDVDECYTALRVLQAEVQAKLTREGDLESESCRFRNVPDKPPNVTTRNRVNTTRNESC